MTSAASCRPHVRSGAEGRPRRHTHEYHSPLNPKPTPGSRRSKSSDAPPPASKHS